MRIGGGIERGNEERIKSSKKKKKKKRGVSAAT
jgi:hypothetical protein